MNTDTCVPFFKLGKIYGWKVTVVREGKKVVKLIRCNLASDAQKIAKWSR